MDNTIYINDKKYEYVNSITLDGKNYVAYMDSRNVYISEYFSKGDELFFDNVKEEDLNRIKEAMGL